MCKIGKLIYQYRYPRQKTMSDKLWKGEGNIGDCIQTIAVCEALKQTGLNLKYVVEGINRDDMRNYEGESIFLPMQAWYGNSYGISCLPPSEKIRPVFIGFHLSKDDDAREDFESRNGVSFLKKYEPIGCRDHDTEKYLRSKGVNAYFSACMTLTLPKREKSPENGKVFIVDVSTSIVNRLPEKIKNDAISDITHYYFFNEYPVTWNEALHMEDVARDTLLRYKNEASMVITSRIHCAMPCLAMGIPVVFIHSWPDDIRLDVLSGILPVYTPDDIPAIDWNPVVPDLRALKDAMLRNFERRMSAALEGTVLSLEESKILINGISNAYKILTVQRPSDANWPTKTVRYRLKKWLKKLCLVCICRLIGK